MVLTSSELEGLLQVRQRSPHTLLGMHPLGDGSGVVVRTFLPNAAKVSVRPTVEKKLPSFDLKRLDDSGLYEGLTKGAPKVYAYELVITVGVLVVLTYTLFQTEQPLRMFLSTTTVAIYVGIMIANIIALRLLPDGMWWLLMAILITWSNDTLAYFTGVTIGKHKLWPRL